MTNFSMLRFLSIMLLHMLSVQTSFAGDAAFELNDINYETSSEPLDLFEEIDISGNVTDEEGNAIIGATILIKGTSTGTTTDVDGNYNLQIPDNGATLVFSYIGFKTQEIETGTGTSINVILVPTAQSLDAITVTGFRGSQQRAIAVKRLAPSVVEAITPEDIGNYSDENLADVLQRVPGLQVDRNDSGNGGGDRVSVRGVGPQFVNVTINGRTPMTSGTEGIGDLRMFNLDVLPPEIIQGAMIYKTSEAHLVEPGLGGLVDFQTLKPLSISYKKDRNYFGSINTRGEYDEITGGGLQPRISALLGAKTADNKLGFYVSGLTSKSTRAYDALFMRAADFDFKIDDDGDGVPDRTVTALASANATHNPVREVRDRTAISTALQWKPAQSWEVVADYTYSEYDNKSSRSLFRPIYADSYGGIFSRDGVQIDEKGVLRFLDTGKSFDLDENGNQVRRRSRLQHSNVHYDNTTKINIGGLNVKYQRDSWTVSADFSISQVDFNQFLGSGAIRRYDLPYTVDFNGRYPVHNINNGETTPLNDPGAAFQRVAGGPAWDRMLIGNNSAIRLDLEKRINDKFSLKFGGRYFNSEVEHREARGPGLAQSPGATDVETQNSFLGEEFDFLDGVNTGYNSWVAIDQDAVEAYSADFYAQRAGGSFEGDFFNPGTGAMALRLGNGFLIEENTTSLYAQADFSTGKMSGNFGLRAINTDLTASAYSSINQTDPGGTGVIDLKEFSATPTIVSSNRWNLTPSLNLNFALKSNINYRVAIVNTISRPEIKDLAPRNAVQVIHPESTSYGENGSINVSNPELKPYSTWQLDNTLELYNEHGGAVVFSAFYKAISDFILPQNIQNVPLSEAGDLGLQSDAASVLDDNLRYNITKPVNFSDATLYGFEIGVRQPLSILSENLSGFGIQANYTFVDSEFKETLTAVFNSFPGSSKHNVNTVFYYENDKFGARVAYNYRSDYLRSIAGSSGDVRANTIFTEGIGQLNFRLNFNIIQDLEFSVSAENLTSSDRRDFLRNDPTIFNRVVARGRVFTFGLRYRF